MKTRFASLMLVLFMLLTLSVSTLADTPVTPMSEVDMENFTIDLAEPPGQPACRHVPG